MTKTHSFPGAGWIRAIALLLMLGLQAGDGYGQAPTAASPTSAERFFAPATFESPKLSPDGTKVMAFMRFDETESAVSIIDLSTKKTEVLLKTHSMEGVNFWWKNNELLLIRNKNAFVSVDLVTGKHLKCDDFGYYATLLHELPEDPEQMLFESYAGYNTTLHRVNLRNGRTFEVERHRKDVRFWYVDRSGTPIGAWGDTEKRHFLLWRVNPDSEWKRHDYPKETLDFIPLGVASQGSGYRLIVRKNHPHGAASVAYYDPATGTSETIASPREVVPERIYPWGRAQEPAAIVYQSDQTSLRFLNTLEAESAHQWLDTVFPGTEQTFVSFSQGNTRAIVLVHDSSNPGTFFIADLPAKKLTVLNSAYSTINPAEMRASRPFNFVTSDGMSLTGRITLPLKSVGPPPLVLCVGSRFDGPRALVKFDRVAQFFASRGYAVARIDHRGTAGYGRDFSRAGDFEVGTGMTRDLIEGTKWLATQRWIDGKRVAIYGFGRAGLIAFQAVSQSDVFQVLINFTTPLDLSDWKLTDFAVSDRSNKELTGVLDDKQSVKSYAKSVHPLKAAERFTIPSFHQYHYLPKRIIRDYSGSAVIGAEREPPDVDRLRYLLKKRKLIHEIILTEGVGNSLLENRLEWKENACRFEAAANFLDQHL